MCNSTRSQQSAVSIGTGRGSWFKAALIWSCLAALLVCWGSSTASYAADELSEQQVLETIATARKAILAKQSPDGAWDTGAPDLKGLKAGGTALVTLALLNTGMTTKDPEIRNALTFLRTQDPDATYAVSLMLMVFALVKDPADKLRMQRMVNQIEGGQITRGPMTGCWGYTCGGGIELGGGDRSNGQFAVLGLYEAAHAGIPVRRDVWERARKHWVLSQGGDGGWNYAGGGGEAGGSSGSMTVAGIASIVMTNAMLQEDKDVDPNGNPKCCGGAEVDPSLERGLAWLKSHFAVGSNPGGGGWILYYLYGLERAGRLSGQRFFGDHDWYREGARWLIAGMDKRKGLWSAGGAEGDPLISSSFALLFLSKGLAPVLINKLQFKSASKDNWNQHPYEIRNLTDRISGADRWPKLVTWQVVDLPTVVKHGSVSDLRQAPVLYLSGSEEPEFGPAETELLKQFVNTGGFIVAVNNCQSDAFKKSIFDLVARMYPKGETSMERLKSDHPIFRSEYPLDGTNVELWGADLGCRTTIVYSPDDIACFWAKWSRLDPPNRHRDLRPRVERAMRIGVNIIAYATGREPPNKLREMELASEKSLVDNVQRGLLQVAQLRHAGGWDTAPKSARNMLLALNRTAGLTASTLPGTVTATDPELFNYSLLVMHGRHRFEMTDEAVERLRNYLLRGNVLFADACCGAAQFDASFRSFAERLFPGQKLERIPANHEMFSARVGHDLKKVRRRVAEPIGANQTLEANQVEGEPFIEGIAVNGRYAVVYSKYDISCALERQATLACAGYIPEDATRLAVNIVQYTLLQDLTTTAGSK